jgi:DNA-binding HxlR family transcriptional regulator
MNSPAQRIGVAAITENLLKRKWSAIILRYLSRGVNDPSEIAKEEAGISPKVMSERLRTMVRYGLIARFPRPAPSEVIEYRLTDLGKKILEMIDTINALDRQLRQGRFARGKTHDVLSDEPGPDEANGTDSFLTARRSADAPARH